MAMVYVKVDVGCVAFLGNSPDCKILAVSRIAAETMSKCL